MIWVGIGFILIGVQALIIAFVHGARKSNQEAAPDLSATLTDRIAEVPTSNLDAVDQHMATVIRDDAAGVVAAALAPDSFEAHAAALIRQAEAHLRRAAGDVTDTPIIPGEQS